MLGVLARDHRRKRSTTSCWQKIVERTTKLDVGDPALGPGVEMGPVIDEKALKKHLEYIEIGKGKGGWWQAAKRVVSPEGGYFLQPTVIADVAPDARLGAGRGFRPGAGRDQGDGLRRRAWTSPTTPSTV